MNRVAVLIVPLALVGSCRREDRRDHRERAAPVEIVDRSAGAATLAATAVEVEPNDSRDVATPLPVATPMRATIDLRPSARGSAASPDGPGKSPTTDSAVANATNDVVDWFRIDIDKPAMLSVLVTPSNGAELAFEFTDARGIVIAKSQRSGAWMKHGIPNVAVTRARYFAKVRTSAATKKRAVSSQAASQTAVIHYEIAAQLVAPEPQDEVEPNGDLQGANALSLDVAAKGYVGWAGDVDVWRLSVETLSARNAIDIDVSAVDGVAFEIDVANGLGKSTVMRKSPRGSQLVVKDLVPNTPPSSSAHYYLTIRGTGANPETPYQVRVTAHVLGVDAELEPNDTIDTAQRFPSDRSIVHATWNAGDVDCFALPVRPGDQTSRVVVDPSSDFDPVVELVVNGKPALTANHGGPGVPEQLPVTVPVTDGAVVRVTNADRTSTTAATYDVALRFDAP